MSDLFSGRSGLYAFLLVVFVMIVSIGIKYLNVVTFTPSKVSSELEEVFNRVEGIGSIAMLKVEFLKEWGDYRISDECSEAVSFSIENSGFEGDVYYISYPDSIEFPGLPTMRFEFRIEKPMRR
ncbi:MAG: hypothetical protein ABFR50_04605 [Candidatus Fermentibacteria bacterium]